MKIFVTAGIGDFLAMECFFPESLRQNLTEIYYATTVATEIIQIMNALPNYPKLKEQITLWDGNCPNSPHCFFSKQHFSRFKLYSEDPNLPDLWDEIEDWSISTRFNYSKPLYNLFELSKPEFHSMGEYSGSSVLKFKLRNVSDIPDNAILICPVTCSGASSKDRSFNNQDWDNTLSYLEKNDQIGVVVGYGETYVPNHSRLINMLNQTAIIKSIEILKACKGYIGIDSFLSVLASKLFDDIKVKSLNPHCYRYAKIYYHPKTDFSFMYGVEPVVRRLFTV